MGRVRVELKERSYDIVIEPGIIRQVGRRIAEFGFSPVLLIVSDEVVYSLYGELLRSSLEQAGFEVHVGLIPPGEEGKTLSTVEKLYDLAVEAALDRGSPVVALGGGVPADVGGFTAATFMRGVPLIQVPTTLLAQVDASVGGKVAVNHDAGKNMIGSFYQPRAVYCDISTLKTLPPREVRAGLAEVIKYAVIWDEGFFAYLEENLDKALDLDEEVVGHIVERSCSIKAGVVARDELDRGLRAILNFGHTFGHALETVTRYQVLRHGEAVAMGMVAASRVAVRLGLLGESEYARIRSLIKRAGLPVDIPPYITKEELVGAFKADKKREGSKFHLILPERIGRVRLNTYLSAGEILALWD